jgi:hypothetical protein
MLPAQSKVPHIRHRPFDPWLLLGLNARRRAERVPGWNAGSAQGQLIVGSSPRKRRHPQVRLVHPDLEVVRDRLSHYLEDREGVEVGCRVKASTPLRSTGRTNTCRE